MYTGKGEPHAHGRFIYITMLSVIKKIRGVEYWCCRPKNGAAPVGSIMGCAYKPHYLSTAGSVKITFIDEKHGDLIAGGVKAYITQKWWGKRFGLAPPAGSKTWQDFVASPVRVVSTAFGILTGLLRTPGTLGITILDEGGTFRDMTEGEAEAARAGGLNPVNTDQCCCCYLSH